VKDIRWSQRARLRSNQG